MALVTNDELITEALELAGDSSLKQRALFWLNRWVISESNKVPWPHTLVTHGPVSVSGGTSRLLLGLEGSELMNRVHSIRGIRRWSSAAGAGRGMHFNGSEEVRDQSPGAWMREFSRDTGMQVNTEDLGNSTWALNFSPVSNAQMDLLLYLKLVPEVQELGQVSPYPNHETLVQALYCYALKHQNDERQMAEENKLQRMVQEDRAVFLKLGGNNQRMNLSSRTFPGRRR